MKKVYASTIVNLAKKEVGTVEKNSNDVKYNTWYYGHSVNDKNKGGCVYPWCMAFISWLFNQSDALNLIGGKSASCSQTINWFQKHKQWYTSNPQIGDLVFFTYSHVGLVIAVNGKTITTIEGNTSSNDSGSQRNGGMVAKRTRTSNIKGYGRPQYDKKPSTEISTKCRLYKKANIVSGSYGNLPVGKEINYIKDCNNGWSNVRTTINNSTYNGFVKNSCIRGRTNLSKYRTGTINVKTAPLHKKNKKASKILVKVPKNTKVKVISIGKFWSNVKVSVDNKKYDGFIWNKKIENAGKGT